MGKRQYYRQLLTQSSAKAFNITAIISFVIAILGGIVVLALPTLGGTLNFLLWAIPAVVFIATVIVEFTLSSYWFYKKTETDKNILIKKARPKLTVERPTDSSYASFGRCWKLRIKNEGTNDAQGCRGQLITLALKTIDPRFSLDGFPVNEYLNWGNDKEFAIIGGTQSLELEIISRDGGSQPFCLAYAKGEDFRRKHPIYTLLDGIIMVIAISSNDTLPIYAVLVFRPDSAFGDLTADLELVEVFHNIPDIKTYQKTRFA